MPDIRFRYFRSIVGHLVPRFGTRDFIGARRDPAEGVKWDTDAVVRIPETEYNRYLREYRRILAAGGLVEVTKTAYDESELGDAHPKTPTKASKASKRATTEEG